MINLKSKNEARVKRHLKIRKNISGTTARPRLAVYRSNKNIFAQIIDDEKQVTLVSASTIDAKNKVETGSNIAAAKLVGERIAKLALEAGISEVVFDRGGYVFRGRVSALASAAREAGLKF